METKSEWNELYKKLKHNSAWPWTDIVSMTNKYCQKIIINKGRVLELGTGSGANIPFFLAYGIDYYGIESSKFATDSILSKYESLRGKLAQGDFSDKKHFNFKFDLVIDRGSLTHNSTAKIENTLRLVKQYLKKGGTFICSDFFSDKHSYVADDNIEFNIDGHTTSLIDYGHLANTGFVHFSNEEHIRSLFSEFKILHLEEKIVINRINNNHTFASWNVVALNE